MNYDEDIAIDSDALDTEWLDQARRMLKYAQHAVKCQADVDRAKERLDVVRAELDKKVRTEPGAYVGELKLTETLIQGTIIQQNQYQVAGKALIDAQYELGMTKAAVTAFAQRKDALENLVRLHGQQYFAGPSVPRDLSKEWEKKQHQSNNDADSAAAVRMRRTKQKESR